MPVWRNW